MSWLHDLKRLLPGQYIYEVSPIIEDLDALEFTKYKIRKVRVYSVTLNTYGLTRFDYTVNPDKKYPDCESCRWEPEFYCADNAFFRSKKAAIEWCEARGFTVYVE